MRIIIVLLTLFIVVPVARSFFGNLGGMAGLLSVLAIAVFIDIYKSSFNNGIKDKIIFVIITILCTPLSYGILSYGHKTNLTNTQKSNLHKWERYSIGFLAFIVVSFAVLAVVVPDTFGVQFLIVMGIIVLGVISFHGLYPNHWELYGSRTKKDTNNIDSIFLRS